MTRAQCPLPVYYSQVEILEFCTPPQSFKTIFKELDSDLSDA